jgi:hypothetical protein
MSIFLCKRSSTASHAMLQTIRLSSSDVSGGAARRRPCGLRSAGCLPRRMMMTSDDSARSWPLWLHPLCLSPPGK